MEASKVTHCRTWASCSTGTLWDEEMKQTFLPSSHWNQWKFSEESCGRLQVVALQSRPGVVKHLGRG